MEIFWNNTIALHARHYPVLYQNDIPMSSLHSCLPCRTQEQQYSVTAPSGTVLSLLPEAYHCVMLLQLLTLVSVSRINAFSQEGDIIPLHNPNLEGH